MPKIVDHDARRTAISRAVARVIERDGIHTVSVRTVAAEAGIQPSTLRHYFPSSDGMLASTIQLLRDDQAERLATLTPTGSTRDDIRQAWLHALPLDDTRRTEAHVWLAITATARTPELRTIVQEINDGLQHLCQVTVHAFASRADVAREAALLRAFTDGLTLNAITAPKTFTPDSITTALDTYLARLAVLA